MNIEAREIQKLYIASKLILDLDEAVTAVTAVTVVTVVTPLLR